MRAVLPLAVLAALIVAAAPFVMASADADASYTVTFDMQGHGAQTQSQMVEAGGYLETPAVPHAFGFGFLGWSVDPEGKGMWNFGDPVESDMTLFAVWSNRYAQTPDDRPSVTEYLGGIELPEASDSDNDAMLIIAGLVMMFMILPVAMRRGHFRARLDGRAQTPWAIRPWIPFLGRNDSCIL